LVSQETRPTPYKTGKKNSQKNEVGEKSLAASNFFPGLRNKFSGLNPDIIISICKCTFSFLERRLKVQRTILEMEWSATSAKGAFLDTVKLVFSFSFPL